MHLRDDAFPATETKNRELRKNREEMEQRSHLTLGFGSLMRAQPLRKDPAAAEDC
jgi:hypothetical protein